MKKCSNCFKLKPLDQFYRKLDRHQSRCKECNAEVVYAYNHKNDPSRIERYLDKRERKKGAC